MRRLAMVMIVLGLALAACGEDAAEPAPATTPSTPSTSSTTSAPIRTTTVPTTPATLECPTVGFTPNSEDAASSVTATGLSCNEAEAFVRLAGAMTSSGGPESVDVEGYSCVRTARQEDPLPRSSYVCTNGSMKVTFVRS